MEASTLKSKKISKGKIKKTMKNVLCRPDQVFWPVISEEQGKEFEDILKTFKTVHSIFVKPQWSEIKHLPKEERPKPPKKQRVEGMLFGITPCLASIPSGKCTAVLIDAEVNPRVLVENVIDSCVKSQVPVLCLAGLKRITKENFGFPCCCIGVDKETQAVNVLRDKVIEISKNHVPKTRPPVDILMKEVKMDTVEVKNINEKPIQFDYVYRRSKDTRTFTPHTQTSTKIKNGFGQDFIEFNNAPKNVDNLNANAYMKMIVKKITNNPNRKKNENVTPNK